MSELWAESPLGLGQLPASVAIVKPINPNPLTPKELVMIGKQTKLTIAGLGLALGGGLLAGSAFGSPGVSSAVSKAPAVAVAQATPTTDPTSQSADTGSAASTDAAAPSPETPLEGDTAAKVTAAARAAVPDGTIDRVETDNDGVYEAHMTKADGSKVIVQVGADFAVTATVDGPQGGHGGGGGHGTETPLEGDAAAKVTAAAQAAIPDGTIDRAETDSDGSPYEAHVTKADGTQVVVKVDASFTVTDTQDMPAGGPQGGRHGGNRGADAPADAPAAGSAGTDSGATATTTA